MPKTISDSIRLYGTDEPVEPPRIVQAGPLRAELEAGNLRYVRYRGHEMIRAISFIVRDENWGTYAPKITDLNFQEEPDSFRVSYGATVSGKDFCIARYPWRHAAATGALRFRRRQWSLLGPAALRSAALCSGNCDRPGRAPE